MKIQAKGGYNCAFLDDGNAGESVSIFFSQSADDVTRWRLEVYAHLDTGSDLLVGTMFVSPPNATVVVGQLTRLVGIAVCPGAETWSVVANASEGAENANEETADLRLFSSRGYTAPAGLYRVGERYGYYAGVAGGAPVSQAILPGQTVTRVQAVGTAAGGVSLGTLITVPNGTTLVLEPKALIPPSATAFSFLNVDWVIEYLESA